MGLLTLALNRGRINQCVILPLRTLNVSQAARGLADESSDGGALGAFGGVQWRSRVGELILLPPA